MDFGTKWGNCAEAHLKLCQTSMMARYCESLYFRKDAPSKLVTVPFPLLLKMFRRPLRVSAKSHIEAVS